ncbi:MAG: hypothetical protein GX357_10055 [Firmicutes bacterium]|nr:hypothetical protein [Bacillota bacterium]
MANFDLKEAHVQMSGMDNLKNVVREPNVVELKPWKSIHDEIKEPMVTGLGPIDIPESVLAMGFARITEPVSLGNPTHKHPFDQWIYIIGEGENFAELDADLEMTLGDEIIKINYPCYIFIPKNVMHCPLEVKRVGKPFLFIDARITEEASVRPESIKKSPQVKYIAKKKE